ncbi:MAG: M14 family metallopeptidase [Bacteroidales bacterium]
MKIVIKHLIVTAVAVLLVNPGVFGQYRDHATLNRDMNNLAKSNSAICEIESLVKTEGGKDILVLTIGTGEKHSKPGIAVLGGIEGSYLLGREIAAGFAENLVKNSSSSEIRDLLSRVTFYVFPDVSPDASEQYFSKIRYERNWNSRSVDLDRDWKTGEDPFEDLNNDGYITLIRVHDLNGTHIESPDDPRILISADRARGQKGKYLVYSEGIDNDDDGQFNEDGDGGVNFNNNWPYNYQEFGRYAGMHAVSEPETKAVADFLYDQWNIFATISFGPQDNLAQSGRGAAGGQAGNAAGAMAARGGAAGDRNTLQIARSDENVNRIIAEKYISVAGVRGTPQNPAARGNFMEWAYFYYGRFSYGTPGWWPNTERGRNSEVAFLKYAEENNLGEVFVPWTEIKHPGFPDQKVEVGGIKPFVMINPPPDKVKDIVTTNYEFIRQMAEMHPAVEISDLVIENTGGDIFRVTLKVENSGLFPTMPEMGVRNKFVRLPRVRLTLDSKQTLITGTKVQQMARIEGNSSVEFSWLIRGKGTISVKAGDVNCGTATISANLK